MLFLVSSSFDFWYLDSLYKNHKLSFVKFFEFAMDLMFILAWFPNGKINCRDVKLSSPYKLLPASNTEAEAHLSQNLLQFSISDKIKVHDRRGSEIALYITTKTIQNSIIFQESLYKNNGTKYFVNLNVYKNKVGIKIELSHYK